MFSVIIPAYNCEHTIVEVLNSVINQSRFDLIREIIIINDGSSDNTDSVIRKYIKKNPDVNIIYEIQENHGVSYTRNKGILRASADWIALLDSDDLWVENKIERQYQIIKENSNVLFLGATYPLKIFIKQRHGLCKLNAKELCIRSMPTTPSIVFKREEGIKLGLFNENMQYAEDINFYQKFLMKDSYYVLAEKLVEIGFSKKYFASSGLTSNLYKMHLGRNANTRELYEMGLISKSYMYLMLGMNNLKYIRRCVKRKWNKVRFNK